MNQAQNLAQAAAQAAILEFGFFLGILFISHLLGDWIFQDEKIASMKSRSTQWLTLHVVIYSMTMLVLVYAYLWFRGVPFELRTNWALGFALANGLAHWGIDLVTSQLSSQAHAIGDRRTFFLVIGVDQCLHALTLIYSAMVWYAPICRAIWIPR